MPSHAPRDLPKPTGLSRRGFVLGAAGGALAAAPLLAGAYPGAKVPELRPTMPWDLQRMLDATRLPASAFGLHIAPVDKKNRVPIVSLNADDAYQMASTTKVVTSLAALDLLGPGFRWRTQAFVDGAIHEGRLLGDLIILGGGDSRLSVDELQTWFRQMQAQGLREVWGDIVLDRFAFRLNETDHASTPLPTPDRPHHARPDALVLNEGVMRVSVQGYQQSAKVHRSDITLQPGLTGLRIVNEMTTGKGCSAQAFVDQREQGDSRLVVRGQWSAACGGREIAQLALPHGEFTLRAVGALWQESGGRLKGRVRDRREIEGESAVPQRLNGDALQPWSTWQSEPLAVLLRDMNKTSDNLAARHLMLSLTPGFPAQAATLPAARTRIREWLVAQGVAVGDIDVDNGSGLSRAEKAKPRALVHLLRNAWNGKMAPILTESLPIAGIDGTLAGRMTEGPARGRAFLKTGTLSDTRALAGYIKAKSNRVYAVAAFVNHLDIGPAPAALDAVIEWVAENG